MAQFNFGSNALNTTPTANFNFGKKAVAPAFGSVGTSQPAGSITFGTPIASVAPTPQSTGLNFGTPAPTLNFGTPATSTTTPSLFGSTPQTTGFSFGAAPVSSAPTLNFGPPATSATGLSFGPPVSSAPPSLFGAPVSSTGFALGTGAGTTQTTTTGLFATPTTSATQPVLGGLNFGTPATTRTNSFALGGTNTGLTGFTGLGATTTTALTFGTTTTSTTGINFGTAFATPASASLNFNFGGSKTPSSTTLTLGSTITPAPSIGLGGVDTSQAKSGTVTTGRADTVAAKENVVPNEILQTLENFKTFVKDQKTHSSDVARGSARPFLKVGEDIDLLNSILSEVGNELERDQQVAIKLKNDSAKCLHNAEIAQRTYDTPPGLQFENTAPMQYFIDLVNQFEQDLQALRMQIDITDKHIQSLQEPRFLTSQELSLGMKRLHDTFVALAGRLQSVHTQVESQKDQYLNLRKYILKDPTNIFLKPTENKSSEQTLQNIVRNSSVSGPTPFTAMSSNLNMMLMAQQQVPNKPPPAYPSSNTTLNFGSPSASFQSSSLLGATPTLGASTSLFTSTPQLGQSPAVESSNFQLQNPPLGNKRGKR